MSQHGPPDWYEPGDIPASLRNVDSTLATDRIVDVLTHHEVDAPRERVWEMVNTARSRVTDTDPAEAETADVEDDPRTRPSRLVAVDDLAYLGARDFALVLGAVLSRYEGSFRPADGADDLAVDLFWHRQHTTVAFRTISRPTSQPVDQSDVETVVRGDTAPSTGRTPSVLGIVSNAGFTVNAQTHAEKHDIELFGTDHLSQWCRDAQLTPEILGTLLEEGERSPEAVDAVLDDLEPMPALVRDVDPLGDVTHTEWNPQGGGDEPSIGTVKQRMPVAEESPTPGTTGELYADPSEDGDFGAFERFKVELEEDTE